MEEAGLTTEIYSLSAQFRVIDRGGMRISFQLIAFLQWAWDSLGVDAARFDCPPARIGMESDIWMA